VAEGTRAQRHNASTEANGWSARAAMIAAAYEFTSPLTSAGRDHGKAAVIAARAPVSVPARSIEHTADFDAVLLRIADDLGRCIEPIGCALSSGAKDIRMPALSQALA